MNFVNTHNKDQDELLNDIGSAIDADIETLISDVDIDTGDIGIPEFEKETIYRNILSQIQKSPRSKLDLILRWAAIVTIVLGIGIGFTTLYKNDDYTPIIAEAYAQKGEKLVIILSDGSRVCLNSDSRLYYPEQFSGKSREVELIGEAYFEIAKNESKPFIVNAYDMMIKVTGTKFNVNAYAENSTIETTLDEGSILIGNSTQKDLHRLKAGQSAEYNRATTICNIQKATTPTDASAWKNNVLIFHDTPLTEVATVLNRRFDIPFHIESSIIADYTYTFNCNANDLSGIIELMESMTPIAFKRDSDKIIIQAK